jgi:hypothetical protein
MFEDLRLRLATEAYLLRAVTRSMRDRRHAIAVVAPALFESIRSTLDSVRPLPERLQAPLAYQVIWNIAATLRERRFVATLSRTERERHVQHSEYKVCYGEGFEIEPRNRLILAKPGRGDDQKALEVAKAVLGRNRSERPQPHPPLVHVNVELAGDVDDWDAFDTDVLARYFGLERGLRVAEGRYLATNGTLQPVFPENGLLLFYSPNGPSDSVMPAGGANAATPAFAYTYQLTGTPAVRPEYYIRERRVVRAEITVERVINLVGLGATGLIGSGAMVTDILS